MSGEAKPLVVIVFLVVGCISLFLFSSFWSPFLKQYFFRSTLVESSSSVVSTVPIPEAFARTGLASTVLAGNSDNERVNVDWSVSAVAGTGNIKLSWESSFSDVHYRVYIDDGSGFDSGVAVGSQSTHNFENLEQGKEYVFKVSALADNRELSHVTLRAATKEQEVFPGDVVINEIAWMGTEASSYDEWVEFYNTTDKEIDFAKLSIFGADTGECLSFSDADGENGTIIKPRSFLIYANHVDDVRDGDGNSLVDIWDATMGMNNKSPGRLVLYNSQDCSGTIVDGVVEEEGGWFAGDGSGKKTMERRYYDEAGNKRESWGTNDGETTFGKDAKGNKILGTPKHENSVYEKEYVGSEGEGSGKITFELPDEIKVGEPFEVLVKVKNMEEDAKYFVKVLAAADEKFYDARTLGADGVTWLAWNGGWDEHPFLETDDDGDAKIKITAKVKKECSSGDFKFKTRLRKEGTSGYIDSEIQKTFVGESSVGSAEGVVLAATQLPQTTLPKEQMVFLGKVSITLGLALHFFLVSLKKSP